MNYRVDYALNRITMYRLMLYYAAGLLIVAFGLGFFKLAPAEPTALAFSATLITGVCWATNHLFAMLYRVPVNRESFYITAFLLALILPPVTATNHLGVEGLILASVVAIASKFVLAIGRRHVFNPVAIGVAASALLLDQPATWWVGASALLPFVVAGGLLVVRKIQRFDMVVVYVLANLVLTLTTTPPPIYLDALKQSVLYSPLFFAGFAMLTEPLTAPHAQWARVAYGAVVGALSSPNVHFGSFYLTPEIAFLIGNGFAYLVSPGGRLKFTLARVEEAASGCYEFVFNPERRLVFRPGQYSEWTLNVRKVDDRGNRRTFTISSAPADQEVRVGVKFYTTPSAFKQSLIAMKKGDVIYGSAPVGAFTLPSDTNEKLAFIAGGIGVTPFRSMVQDLLDRQDKRSVVLLYGANRVDEIAYSDLFDRAERELGLRTVYSVADDAPPGSKIYSGFIDEDLIQREIPDYKDRTFYISGPRVMVTQFQRALKDLGVARSRTKVDFFPGFA